MKNNKFIFDVDGTITPSRRNIDTAFKEWFSTFCINNNVYLVTGSDYSKTVEQLGEDLCALPIAIYNCSGNEVWTKNRIVSVKDWQPPSDIYDFLDSWLQASKFPARTGNHLEKRTGCLNFSIVGRNATLGERLLYKNWDTANRERETIAFQINNIFEGITATIGGELGIDIHPTGWDKSQILKDFNLHNDKIYFFGDKTSPGGNDYPLAKQLKNVYTVKQWQDTWETLMYFQECKIAL
jgi:phosphomannomutase